MQGWVLAAATLTLGTFAFASPAVPATDGADVALVMAVDVSSSVDSARFALQREGIAEGLKSPAVLDAIAGGPSRKIELAIIEWSEQQQVLLDWKVIRGPADLDQVVQTLRTTARPRVGWKTDVGGGITKALSLFDSAPLAAARKVIDVSGDGAQNEGHLSADQARDAALAGGATVNGLPITSGDEPNVDKWYSAHVVGGAGAFMIVANGHEGFSDAIRQKLTIEIAGRVPEFRLAAASQTAASLAPPLE
jgi:Protein of unknown function (DUF1194)